MKPWNVWAEYAASRPIPPSPKFMGRWMCVWVCGGGLPFHLIYSLGGNSTSHPFAKYMDVCVCVWKDCYSTAHPLSNCVGVGVWMWMGCAITHLPSASLIEVSQSSTSHPLLSTWVCMSDDLALKYMGVCGCGCGCG